MGIDTSELGLPELDPEADGVGVIVSELPANCLGRVYLLTFENGFSAYDRLIKFSNTITEGEGGVPMIETLLVFKVLGPFKYHKRLSAQ